MNQPTEIIQKILHDMDKNIHLLENGDEIEMQSFDERIRAFCTMLGTLPAVEAKKYQANLQQIIERLTNLIPKLEHKKGELENQISALNKRNIANNAYGNALILAMQNSTGEE